jgi:hypothetical protein
MEEESTQSTTRQKTRIAPFVRGPFDAPRREPVTQKSLPDLRPLSHHHVGSKDPSRMALDQFAIPTPPHRQESESSNGSVANFRLGKALGQARVVSSPVSLHHPVPPMDAERNSYFRRMSALTPTVLSKSIPRDLLALMDTVRGILFSVCQIYQTLQHYTVYAIDERLSAVLLKVLQPAMTCMTQLIQALDRFDSISRRMLPSTTVCRIVIESCRENVVVFGRAVGVLSLQLKIIATNDDARYTRQMLLVLYGATAEISNAWSAITSRIESVKPYLRHSRPSPIRSAQAPSSLGSAALPPLTSPSGVQLPSEGQPSPRPSLSRSNSHGLPITRMNRRHAGSFSYEDVELGKMMPAFIEDPLPSPGPAAGSPLYPPTLHPGRRPSAVSAISVNGIMSQDGTVRPSTSASKWDSHSRQSSASSFLATSSSSPALGYRKPSALEVESSTINWIDKEAIDAVKAAVEAASVVWDMTDEMLLDNFSVGPEFQGKLAKAKDVTHRLKDNIRLLGTGDSSVDRTLIREDAHLFANVSVLTVVLFGVLLTFVDM